MEIYLKKIAETQKIRDSFKKPPLKKLCYYPIPLIIFKAIERIFPSLRDWIWVKNKLFFSEPFYTLGYWIDYSLCGFLTEDYEVRLTKFLIQSIKTSDIFMDIGAHYGFYTLLVHKLIAQSLESEEGISLRSVYSFEPTPETYKVLIKNIGCKNISAHQLALSSIKGETEFINFDGIHKTQNSLCTHLAAKKVGLKKFRISQVTTTTMDEFCSNHHITPTKIKMDIEGSEYNVLYGALHILKNHHPVVIMEIWGKGYNLNHLKGAELLFSLDYHAYKIDSNGQLIMIQPDYISDFEPFAVDNIVFKK